MAQTSAVNPYGTSGVSQKINPTDASFQKSVQAFAGKYEQGSIALPEHNGYSGLGPSANIQKMAVPGGTANTIAIA